MKSNSLIIDLRRQLPWHKRYASNTSTAMMWAVWLLLWRPVLIVAGLMSLQKHHVLQHLFGSFGLGLEHGITALFACVAALLLWSNYMPAKTVEKTQVKTMTDYVHHFNVPVKEVEQGRQKKISIVHHDEHGKIVRIES
ncbi:poly-beta-1,6-N-acetyl-D-glucosamine biosynthesis protein PgaD [Acinetobacter sp. ANC 3813]|uniref:poly-beta-1,6-N-acetyl-D-glucosamine biosynthesis protein PgaD n=1 Tax=Acinetobacter sp. ANC 3813 TaxID=1977873 RepID=UPI000A349E8B|nr:poly-beta-1,6-N-acetyl-D-glucosamine biosynthesis protein PgaD [Acinetobacter sp. ANC 3813]OTG91606.1 poly-beta-1,6-N-acetyl-D-glucosamine biosynthesis protein PgaD [Acinetobacter sp. ANC 3813]